LIDWLFYEARVHRIQGSVPSYNRLAPRFVLSFGFKYEGEVREAVKWKDSYHNMQLYGLLEHEWRSWKGRQVQ
jgi:RimJ/RimL family protein N-acetyltransferase